MSAPKNIHVSIHQRLLNAAKQSGRPFNDLVMYYAMERFLYRLSVSPYADQVVLKGGLMLQVWGASATRVTKDIDLLGKAHVHVEATRDSLSHQTAPLTPREWARQNHKRPTIQVEVSKALRTRALCILDALIRSVEKIGGTIEQKSETYYYRSVQILEIEFAGESLGSFRIREQQKRVAIPESKREYRFSPASEMVNTGLLTLRVGPTYGEIYIKDSGTSSIEDNLNDLILKLVKRAALIRQRRVEREEEERRREEEARIRFEREQELKRRREELEKRQKTEQRRVDRLLADVEHRRLSKQIREYLDEVCVMLMKRDNVTSIHVDSEAADFFRWAHQQADRFDPLKDSPPSVLDESI